MNQVAELRQRLEAIQATPAAAAAPRAAAAHAHLKRSSRPCRRHRARLAPTPPPIVPGRESIAPPPSQLDSRRRRGGTTAAAAATRRRLRGTHRHPLGGVDRRADAGARRILHGALFDRGRPARPRRAHAAGRPVRAGPAAGRRMDAPQGEPSPRSTALPIANIPAILTAAGTAVAFATVYAAYALYGFLAPATAFILLGLVALGTLAAALLHGPALAGLGVVGAFVTPVLVSSEQAGLLGALYLSRRSSPRRRSAWRGSGCGAGSRSPRSRSRCCGRSPACNAVRRWSARMRSTCSPDSSSPRCLWCAASCSARPPTKARSSRSRPARLRPICSAPP